MANHKYHGDWRYFENPDGGNDVFTQDDTMKLRIPENGNVDPNTSSHKGNKVSGKARNNGVSLSRIGSGNTRTLEGMTMFEIPLSSGDVMAVISGRFRDVGRDLVQQEGDWVIVKP